MSLVWEKHEILSPPTDEEVARMEPDSYLRQAYQFGVLEDFDHLYRYANLYEMIDRRKAAASGGVAGAGRPCSWQRAACRSARPWPESTRSAEAWP